MEGDKIQGSTGREIELIKKKRKGVRKKNLINTVCESNTFFGRTWVIRKYTLSFCC